MGSSQSIKIIYILNYESGSPCEFHFGSQSFIPAPLPFTKITNPFLCGLELCIKICRRYHSTRSLYCHKSRSEIKRAYIHTHIHRTKAHLVCFRRLLQLSVNVENMTAISVANGQDGHVALLQYFKIVPHCSLSME